MRKHVVWIGVVVFLLLSTFTGFSLMASTLPREETLIVDILTGRVTNPKNFNLWATWVNNDKGLQQLIADPLWTVEYTTGEIINTLAEELPIYNENFTKMTVKLRKGIYWSDGVEFKADDVVFTVETLKKNPGMNYSTAFNIALEKVYKTDDYTVVFELKKPNARFHSYFLDRWGACRIFPKHIWEKVDDPLTYNFYPPVGTGPYILKDYDKVGYWFIYEKRKDWNRTAVGMLYGEPKPKYVQFVYYGPPEKKIMAQARHELDMCDLTIESLLVSLKKNPYARGFYKDFPWAETLHPCVTGATFNCDKFPFNIRDVRWALNLAVDATDIVMTAYDGASALAPAFIPATLPFYKWYYEPLQPWLENFTLDIDGKPYKPYDSTIPFKIAELSKKRGYSVPTEPKEIKTMFGYGWWKHAPEVAEKLLMKHGFKRDEKDKWLLPDGSLWKITIFCSTNPAHPAFKWAFALAEQWRRFGIEVKAAPSEARATLDSKGEFDVNGNWPVTEPWGSHPDLYRSFSTYHSKFYKPIGELAVGHQSRWSDPRLDRVLNEMETTAFNDPKITEQAMEAAKIVVEGMPGLSLASYTSFIGWDEYYWKNYPGGENPYCQPHYHWPNFKFMLPFLEPTGRK